MRRSHISQMIQDLFETKQMTTFAKYVQSERSVDQNARRRPL